MWYHNTFSTTTSPQQQDVTTSTTQHQERCCTTQHSEMHLVNNNKVQQPQQLNTRDAVVQNNSIHNYIPHHVPQHIISNYLVPTVVQYIYKNLLINYLQHQMLSTQLHTKHGTVWRHQGTTRVPPVQHLHNYGQWPSTSTTRTSTTSTRSSSDRTWNIRILYYNIFIVTYKRKIYFCSKWLAKQFFFLLVFLFYLRDSVESWPYFTTNYHQTNPPSRIPPQRLNTSQIQVKTYSEKQYKYVTEIIP
jgi:hypothetical protein